MIPIIHPIIINETTEVKIRKYYYRNNNNNSNNFIFLLSLFILIMIMSSLSSFMIRSTSSNILSASTKVFQSSLSSRHIVLVASSRQQSILSKSASINQIVLSSSFQRFKKVQPSLKSMIRMMSSSSSIDGMIGNNVNFAMETLYNSDCICFDVDSTVIQEEGIDVLAAYLKKGDEVSAVTKRAMDGNMKFQDALSIRLNILQPSKQQIERCMMIHPFQLSNHIQTLIDTLHSMNKDVYFISGGFRVMIEPIAVQLNINPITNLIANTLIFDYDGFYESFDKTEPTSADMGKAIAVQSIIDKHQYKNVVMIGDGYTDTQAKPPATAFIGYGGVTVREQVKELSDWYVTDFQVVIDYLESKQNEQK